MKKGRGKNKKIDKTEIIESEKKSSDKKFYKDKFENIDAIEMERLSMEIAKENDKMEIAPSEPSASSSGYDKALFEMPALPSTGLDDLD